MRVLKGHCKDLLKDPQEWRYLVGFNLLLIQRATYSNFRTRMCMLKILEPVQWVEETLIQRSKRFMVDKEKYLNHPSNTHNNTRFVNSVNDHLSLIVFL